MSQVDSLTTAQMEHAPQNTPQTSALLISGATSTPLLHPPVFVNKPAKATMIVPQLLLIWPVTKSLIYSKIPTSITCVCPFALMPHVKNMEISSVPVPRIKWSDLLTTKLALATPPNAPLVTQQHAQQLKNATISLLFVKMRNNALMASTVYAPQASVIRQDRTVFLAPLTLTPLK